LINSLVFTGELMSFWGSFGVVDGVVSSIAGGAVLNIHYGFIYFFGAGGAMFGLIGLAAGDLPLGLTSLAISLPFLSFWIYEKVRDIRRGKLLESYAARDSEMKALEKQRRLAREKEVADKWWRDHHRGIWDPSYSPPSVASIGRRGDGSAQLPDSTPVQESEQEWIQNRVRPLAQKYGVSHRGAEELAAEWLRFLGEHGVEITSYSQDGGADVLTASYCCQVKNYEKKPVGVVEVRALLGTAVSQKLKPLLFTASKPTNEALIFCNENDIAVVEFDATNALLFGLTTEGHTLLSQGRYN
jgi:hypothetical protein